MDSPTTRLYTTTPRFPALLRLRGIGGCRGAHDIDSLYCWPSYFGELDCKEILVTQPRYEDPIAIISQ